MTSHIQGTDVGNTRAQIVTMTPEKLDELHSILAERGVEADPEDLFFFPAEISSTRLDAWYTRMHETSLTNYAADARAGVAFLIGHNNRGTGVGRSVEGRFLREDGARVIAHFYTHRGLVLDGYRTDDLITGIRSGIIKDVSVGFKDADFECGVCGNNVYSRECSHFPGVAYDEINGDRAWAWVKNAHLREVSGVYDGATPNAMILKAERMVPSMSQLQVAQFEDVYSVRISPGATYSIPKKGRSMSVENVLAAAGFPVEGEDVERSVRSLVGALTEVRDSAEGLTTTVEATRAERDEALKTVENLTVRVGELEKANVGLEGDAALGRQYRTDLIEQAIEAGIRCHGDDFAEESYRGLMENAPLEAIRRMRDDWDRTAATILQVGRQTQDQQDSGTDDKNKKKTPDMPGLYRI